MLCLALRETPIPVGAEVLHFAPEHAVTRLLGHTKYRSADLAPGSADLVLNIESIDLATESVDFVIASHVLEHVDDRAALREIWRILRPGGSLIAMVPIVEGWAQTYEDAARTTASERELHFGQNDHVRYYGRDFRDRLIAAGFSLREFVAGGPDCVRFGLTRGERVFFGTKVAG